VNTRRGKRFFRLSYPHEFSGGQRQRIDLVFKILQSCEQRWSRISHPEKLKEVKLPKIDN
jgi:hypothetical protein